MLFRSFYHGQGLLCQSAEEPIFFNWLMMRLPYSSRHSQHFSKNPSLPRSRLSMPCFFRFSITFTSVAMDAWSEAVLEVFVKLYEKGLIYKGSRIVNWCPVCKTSISDAEVEHEEQDGFFWHINYPVVGGVNLRRIYQLLRADQYRFLKIYSSCVPGNHEPVRGTIRYGTVLCPSAHSRRKSYG